MKIEILENKRNNLFKRLELKGIIYAEKTPSKKEIIELISSEMNMPLENIQIIKISSSFGIKKFDFIANVYDSIKEKDFFESKKEKSKK